MDFVLNGNWVQTSLSWRRAVLGRITDQGGDWDYHGDSLGDSGWGGLCFSLASGFSSVLHSCLLWAWLTSCSFTKREKEPLFPWLGLQPQSPAQPQTLDLLLVAGELWQCKRMMAPYSANFMSRDGVRRVVLKEPSLAGGKWPWCATAGGSINFFRSLYIRLLGSLPGSVGGSDIGIRGSCFVFILRESWSLQAWLG